jgi:hypothetical protein
MGVDREFRDRYLRAPSAGGKSSKELVEQLDRKKRLPDVD